MKFSKVSWAFCVASFYEKKIKAVGKFSMFLVCLFNLFWIITN